MNLEEILIKLGLDGTGMERGLRTAGEKVSEWAKEQMKLLSGIAAGYIGMEGFKTAYEDTVEFSEKTVDLSRHLGISTDAIQVWDFALKQNGATIEAASSFFEKLAVSREKALGGLGAGAEEIKTLTATFGELGISIDDLKNKRLEDIAEKIGEIFQSGDPQKLIASLKEVGGKGAGEVIATLRDGIKEAREEAEKLGIIIEHNVLLKLKETADRQTQFGAQLRAAFAPWVSSMVEGLQFLFTATKAGVSDVSAVFKALSEHPTHIADAFRAGKAARDQVWDDMVDSDKALRRHEQRLDDPKTGGSDTEDPETEKANKKKKEQAEIDRLNDESEKLEDKATTKKLSNTEKIKKLESDRLILMGYYNDKTNTELEKAQVRKALAENAVDLQDTLNEKKEKDKNLTKEIADTERDIGFVKREQAEDQRSAAYSTVEELARSRDWGGKDYSATARRILRDQIDAKRFAGHDEARVTRDLADREKMNLYLEKSSVTRPDHKLESIDERLKVLNERLVDLGIKIQEN